MRMRINLNEAVVDGEAGSVAFKLIAESKDDKDLLTSVADKEDPFRLCVDHLRIRDASKREVRLVIVAEDSQHDYRDIIAEKLKAFSHLPDVTLGLGQVLDALPEDAGCVAIYSARYSDGVWATAKDTKKLKVTRMLTPESTVNYFDVPAAIAPYASY